MAQPATHPFPCPGRPEFPTQHEARDFILRYQEAGHIKRCQHVRVTPRAATNPTNLAIFRHITVHDVRCGQESFRVLLEPRKTAEAAEGLGLGRPYNFYGCPADCHFYAAAWRATTKRRAAAVGSWLVVPLAGLWRGYVALPAGAQTAIALALLVALITFAVPSLKAPLLEIIRAVKQ